MQNSIVLNNKLRIKVEDILGKGGVVAKKLDNYEERIQQIQMGKAVEDAIQKEEHLIVEAGTGIGKGLAYLIPLIYWTAEEEKRVLVSTYTKTLQEQLVKRDLPFLKDTLGVDFDFALVVGAENYLCLRRLERARAYELLDTKKEVKELEGIFQAQPYFKAGLKSELIFEPSAKVWGRVCRNADLCMGKKCSHQRDCYYTRARKKMRKSQVLVVNHHLFFAHLASEEKVLPSFKGVVFDEAHNLEDVATSFLGMEVSNLEIRFLLNSLFNPRSQKGLIFRIKELKKEERDLLEGSVGEVRAASDLFFSNLRNKLGDDNVKRRIKEKKFVANLLDDPFSRLIFILNLLLDKKEEEGEDEDEEMKLEISSHLSRCLGIKDNLKRIIEQEEEDYVYWAEVSSKRKIARYALHAAPIDIALQLKRRVFDKIKMVVLTSATLATNKNFTFIRERIGLKEGRELLLDSPFDYLNQVLLYLPSEIPDPWREVSHYSSRVVREIKNILKIVKGYTFILFTSFQMLNQIYEEIKEERDNLKILRQGDMPRYRLLEEFKKDEGSILLGTNTFWQGVDVPGQALQCVIITKLPFAVPNEPVVEAKIEFLKAQNKNPFPHYQLPQAIILLKQGFGRLIRSKKDRGIVAILDPRLKTRHYGKMFLGSLPRCRMTSSLRELGEFMQKAA